MFHVNRSSVPSSAAYNFTASAPAQTPMEHAFSNSLITQATQQNTLPQPALLREIPPYARSWWFFKDAQENSNIPYDYLENVADFAELNHNFQVDFITNDASRLASSFYFPPPQNLRITEARFTSDNEFPLIGALSKASIALLPQNAKDMRSYQSLYENPGLSFDPDSQWYSALPYPLYINGDIAVHTDYHPSVGTHYPENAIVALPRESVPLMHSILSKIHGNIFNLYDFSYDHHSNTSRFSIRDEDEYAKKQDIVDATQYTDFYKTVKDAQFVPVSSFADYYTPSSTYGGARLPSTIFEG